MPPRSVKMKRFIFGFQRRVWWPKWTPASSSSFMETAGMGAPFFGFDCGSAGGPRVETGANARPPSTEVAPPGRRDVQRANGTGSAEGVEVRGEVRRERRRRLDPGAGDRVRERELGGVQELPRKRRVGDAVDRVPD